MELKPMYRHVIGLDIDQAKISACAVSEQSDGEAVVEMREFGGFKRDRRALAQWVKSRATRQKRARSQDRCGRCPVAGHLGSCGAAACIIYPTGRHRPFAPRLPVSVKNSAPCSLPRKTGCTKSSLMRASDSALWSAMFMAKLHSPW